MINGRRRPGDDDTDDSGDDVQVRNAVYNASSVEFARGHLKTVPLPKFFAGQKFASARKKGS